MRLMSGLKRREEKKKGCREERKEGTKGLKWERLRTRDEWRGGESPGNSGPQTRNDEGSTGDALSACSSTPAL